MKKTSKTKKVPTKAPKRDANAAAGKFLDGVYQDFLPNVEESAFRGRKLDFTKTGKVILAKPLPFQAVVVRVVLSRNEKMEKAVANTQAKRSKRGLPPDTWPWRVKWKEHWVYKTTLRGLLRHKLPLTEKDVLRLVRWSLNDPDGRLCNRRFPLVGIHVAITNYLQEFGLTPAMAEACEAMLAALRCNSQEKENPKFIDKFAALLKWGK